MTEELENYQRSIKRRHRFGWTPKYEEEFRTYLNKSGFIQIALKTFEKLNWDVIYQDETSVEARSEQSKWKSGYKITVDFAYGKANVKSECLGNESWDMGRNSKKVRLFMYAFEQTEKEYDKEALTALEEEAEKASNWDDYQIPESLPGPKQQKKPQWWIPVAGGIMTALLFGLSLAFISLKAIYIIGLFEVGIGFGLGFALSKLIRFSNYTDYNKLTYIIIGMVILVYLSNQYFQYRIILIENNFQPIGFFEFIKLRLESGLTIKTLNTGWIGLVISWIFQLGLTYAIGLLRLTSVLISYQVGKVPREVVEFATFHFIRNKSETEVRGELAKMGWYDKQDQDDVFDAIEALQVAADLNRG